MCADAVFLQWRWGDFVAPTIQFNLTSSWAFVPEPPTESISAESTFQIRGHVVFIVGNWPTFISDPLNKPQSLQLYAKGQKSS